MQSVVSGITLPSNARAYLIIPSEDVSSITVQHDLGVVPVFATMINLEEDTNIGAVTFSTLAYNPTKNNITFRAAHALNNNPTAGNYQSNMVDPVMGSQSVQFTASQYYGLKYKANTKYLCIIVAEQNS